MNAGIKVSVPATTANLGPGFDCLALALNLWNETVFVPDGSALHITIQGEGSGLMPENESNTIVQAAKQLYKNYQQPFPSGLHIYCKNRIPVSSGLGSSSSAILAGLLGANALLGHPADQETILQQASQMEGHVDNLAAALYGGLVVTSSKDRGFLIRRFDIPSLNIIVILPNVNLTTRQSRSILPEKVNRNDAIFNLGHAIMVVDALRTGDLDLLKDAMQDRLHQPYRMKLIPGSEAALTAARASGAMGAGLSGAGPSLVAFSQEGANKIAEAMVSAFEYSGVAARSFYLTNTNRGATIKALNSLPNSTP